MTVVLTISNLNSKILVFTFGNIYMFENSRINHTLREFFTQIQVWKWLPCVSGLFRRHFWAVTENFCCWRSRRVVVLLIKNLKNLLKGNSPTDRIKKPLSEYCHEVHCRDFVAFVAMVVVGFGYDHVVLRASLDSIRHASVYALTQTRATRRATRRLGRQK